MDYGSKELNDQMNSSEYLVEYGEKARATIEKVVGEKIDPKENPAYSSGEYIVRCLIKNAEEKGIDDSEYIAERILGMRGSFVL